MFLLGDEGQLLWNDNWISFLDTMLQIQVLGLPGRGLRLPTRIKAVHIDPNVHLGSMIEVDDEKQGTAHVIFSTCI